MKEQSSNAAANHGFRTPLLILSLVSLLGVGLTVWLESGFNREPLHNGKSIRYWVNKACGPTSSVFLSEFPSIGPAAVPYLQSKLRTEDTWLRRSWIKLRWALPAPLRSILPECEDAVLVRSRAAASLALLGPDAKPAVADLVRLINEAKLNKDRGTYEVRGNYALALGEIGVANQQVIAALRSAATDRNRDVKACAATALWRLDRQYAQLAAPIVVKFAAIDLHWDSFVKFARKHQLDLNAAVPSLRDLLSSESPQIRKAAAEALKEVGELTEDEFNSSQ